MPLNRLISIAPMMDCTDRHFRFLVRLFSKHVLLYSEMVTANAVIHGNRERLLGFNPVEEPLALQLGGSDPATLAQASVIGEQWGYDEINLNVGCPSNRVQSGRFGVCLMKEPIKVYECVSAMQASVNVPVTVKCRIGVDDMESYDHLCHFVSTVAESGCHSFAIHARKAWLNGLSPKQNRHIPPLKYDVVYQLKRDFPHLEIVINGGVKTHEEIRSHLEHVDGVMIGREAYGNPYWLSRFDQSYYGSSKKVVTRKEAALTYLDYVCQQVGVGANLSLLTKHMLGLFQGVKGAKRWRHFLCEKSRQPEGWRDLEREARSFFETLSDEQA